MQQQLSGQIYSWKRSVMLAMCVGNEVINKVSRMRLRHSRAYSTPHTELIKCAVVLGSARVPHLLLVLGSNRVLPVAQQVVIRIRQGSAVEGRIERCRGLHRPRIATGSLHDYLSRASRGFLTLALGPRHPLESVDDVI